MSDHGAVGPDARADRAAMGTQGPVERFIGLMSGTSLDGVDAVLCRFGPAASWQGVEAHVHLDFTPALRQAFEALQASGADELHRAALAANGLARAYADATAELLRTSGLAPADITALGAHGQTVRHQPGLHDGTGYTVQLNQPALLAELTGLPVVADFRSRDLAAGGQGAPLVPPFHRALFGRDGQTVAVLNLGGIANLTVLAPDAPLLGFDCGPANTLLDGWCLRHRGTAWDAGGAWSAGGAVLQHLLRQLLADPYFALPPPKSTGRDHFHLGWLDEALARLHPQPSPQDVQATLCALTAHSVAAAVQRHAADAVELLVCGGGAFNTDLMRRLQALLPGLALHTTAAHGLPPMQVEAAAFAWLAACCWHRLPANDPLVTGAGGARVLGAIYPA